MTENTDENAQTQEVINFNITDAALTELAERHKDVDAHQDIDRAKVAATECQQLRKKLTEAHKFKKADALAFGRRLDAEKNRIMSLIGDIEDPIRTQLDKIRNAEIQAEEERVGEINEQIERIKAFANDRYDLTVEQLEERKATVTAIEITEEVFAEFMETAQLFKDESIAKLRIAISAEHDRLAEAEALDTQRLAQEETQRKLDEQQAALDAQAEAQRREREEIEAEERKKLTEANATKQAGLDQQEEQNAIEAKRLQDIEDAAAEAAAQADLEAAKLLRAPDRDKLLHFADMLDEMIKAKPTMVSQEGANIMLVVAADLIDLIAIIKDQVEEMK